MDRDGPAPPPTGSAGVTLRLRYAEPFDWQAILEFLAYRAIPGVEIVADGCYWRTVEVGGRHGFVQVRPAARGSALEATMVVHDTGALPEIESSTSPPTSKPSRRTCRGTRSCGGSSAPGQASGYQEPGMASSSRFGRSSVSRSR
jgi:hypothetical protein